MQRGVKYTAYKPSEPVVAPSQPAVPAPTREEMTFKIKVLGDGGSGKTAIIDRLIDDKYVDNLGYTPNVGSSTRVHTVDNNGKPIKLQMWDEQSNERFRSIPSGSDRGHHVFVVAFDVTDQISFNELNKQIERAQALGNETAPIVLVATKCDMTSKRVVDQAQIQQFAEALAQSGRDVRVVETSAKTGQNMEQLQQEVVNAACQRYRPDLLPADSKASTQQAESTQGKSQSPNPMKHLDKLEKAWQAAKTQGKSDLDSAVDVLRKYVDGDSLLKRFNPTQAPKWGTTAVRGIVNYYDANKQNIPDLNKLTEHLDRIPGRRPGTYLSDFIDFVKEKQGRQQDMTQTQTTSMRSGPR